MLRGKRAELLAIVGTAALVLGSVGLGGATPTAAAAPDAGDRQAQIDRELDRLRSEFGETVADEREALAEYTVSRNEKARLDAEVTRLDGDIAATQEALALAQERLGAAEAHATTLEGIVEGARQRLETARDDARRQVVAAYVHHDVLVYAPLLLLASSDDGLVTGLGYTQAIGDHQEAVVGRYAEAWDRSESQRVEAEAARAQAAAEQDAVLQQEAQLEASRAEQTAAQAEAAVEVATQRQLLRKIQATKGDYVARINALERESAEIAELLRRRQAGQGRYSGTLQFPLPGYAVGSSFGMRRHPIFGDVRLHAGIDISAPTGARVRAAAAGDVIASRNCGGYGTCVIIDHGGSLATLSAHLSATNVRLGDHVTAGQVIGQVGSTGQATGPHLHFEVRINGTPVDPMPYL